MTPYFAVAFYTYETAANAMQKYNTETYDSEKLSILQCSIAGGLTAFPCSLFVSPSERVKCLLQVQNSSSSSGTKYSGSWDCAKQLYRTGGLRSIYRGIGITILRDSPGNAAYFGTNQLMKNTFASVLGYEDTSKLPIPLILLAGGFSGVTNWIVAIPFDVVKSRLQTAPEGMYSGALDVMKEMIKKEGVNSFYRGIAPSLLRAFPSNSAAFLGVELAHTWLGNR